MAYNRGGGKGRGLAGIVSVTRVTAVTFVTSKVACGTIGC